MRQKGRRQHEVGVWSAQAIGWRHYPRHGRKRIPREDMLVVRHRWRQADRAKFEEVALVSPHQEREAAAGVDMPVLAVAGVPGGASRPFCGAAPAWLVTLIAARKTLSIATMAGPGLRDYPGAEHQCQGGLSNVRLAATIDHRSAPPWAKRGGFRGMGMLMSFRRINFACASRAARRRLRCCMDAGSQCGSEQYVTETLKH